MASDSRTNAGHDQVNVARKMHVFAQPGERVFILLSSGSLSCTQSIITQLRRDFDEGKGLAQAPSLYDAARIIGEEVRRVSDMDRAALERDEFKFNVNFIVGGQVRGELPGLFIVYPQGNPLQASEDSPYLQIGETKYGRPILDRGIRFDKTTLEEAAKYALLSLDSTMRSNVTVGPPIDLLAYGVDELESAMTRASRSRRKRRASSSSSRRTRPMSPPSRPASGLPSGAPSVSQRSLLLSASAPGAAARVERLKARPRPDKSRAATSSSFSSVSGFSRWASYPALQVRV